ncbi:serine acetyltransferase [Photobacterium kishitanii]|uniref:serine O-acetyltransferase n=1 Tax=Photobacterium kishitanii TaxID=318456 RepID=UPI000D1593A0|nr:DapH/DapD/GlmU-related protein [Photobacterium kishitanii]PSU95378.1 serine acetyltransferase [Photobacterium kishitanii]
MLSRIPLYIYKLYHFLYKIKIPFLPSLLCLFNRLIFGCYIPPQVLLGKNVRFGYGGSGVVIHKNCNIGDNVIISPGVVLGGRGQTLVPKIGNNVFIGPNAVILGSTIIGNNVVVGANSTVIDCIVPDNYIVIVNKASILVRSKM